MDEETETRLLDHWVSMYQAFEYAYRAVYVENAVQKKNKAHVDNAHTEPKNTHVNTVLHQPAAKWCIVLCLDAMVSTALTDDVNDQNAASKWKKHMRNRIFNQHEVFRTCVFQPKPKHQAPPKIEYKVAYASLSLPGLYCPQPGYYLPCPLDISASNLVTSDGQQCNNSSEENLASLGFPSSEQTYHPVLPGDFLTFSRPAHICISLLHPRYPFVTSSTPPAMNPTKRSAQDHFRQASVGSGSNSALAVLKQHIVAAAAVATGAPLNPASTAATSSSASSSSSSLSSDKNNESTSRSSSSTGGTRKRTLETDAPLSVVTVAAFVAVVPPLPLMPTATVPDWVPAPWQPMPGHPHPFAGLPLTLFPGMPPPAPLHMGHGVAAPKVS